MHQIWAIQELLHPILSSLSNKDLISMACTNKAFRLPALSRVWEEIDDAGISALVGVLSARENETPENKWTCFHEYAGLVRAVHVRSIPEDVKVEFHHLPCLRPHPSLPLLPRLDRLDIHPLKAEDILVALSFLHPGLRDLTLDVSEVDLMDLMDRDSPMDRLWYQYVESALYRLEQEGDGITCLTLLLPWVDYSEYEPLIHDGFLEGSFPNLVSFEGQTSAFNDHSVYQLGQKKSLRTLRLTKATADDSLDLSQLNAFSPLGSAFSSLRKLEFEDYCSESITLLTYITGPLQAITCRVTWAEPPEQVRALINAVVKFGATLEDLHLDICCFTPRNCEAGSWQNLASLAECGRLQNVRIRYELQGTFHFTDADLLSFALSCPHLRRLSVEWARKQEPSHGLPAVVQGLSEETAISLHGVAYALQNCPNLTNLHLTTIFADIAASSTVAFSPIHRFVELNTECLSTSAPFKTAIFLSTWLLDVRISLASPMRSYLDAELRASPNGRQVSYIMTLLEAIRCHRQVMGQSATPHPFDKPAVVQEVETLLKV